MTAQDGMRWFGFEVQVEFSDEHGHTKYRTLKEHFAVRDSAEQFLKLYLASHKECHRGYVQEKILKAAQ